MDHLVGALHELADLLDVAEGSRLIGLDDTIASDKKLSYRALRAKRTAENAAALLSEAEQLKKRLLHRKVREMFSGRPELVAVDCALARPLDSTAVEGLEGAVTHEGVLTVLRIPVAAAATRNKARHNSPNLDTRFPLLERDEAALDLAETLLLPIGDELTPVLDQSFGAGKTSLCYRFREILVQLVANEGNHRAAVLKAHPRLESLLGATYIWVQMSETPFAREMRERDYVKIFTQVFYQKLVLSLGLRAEPLGEFDTITAAVTYLASLIPEDVLFLWHIDDVQVVHAASGDPVGLYYLWHFVHQLCTVQTRHFYVLSGRSRFLHKIGRDHLPFDLRPDSALSPRNVRVIKALPLSSNAIKEFFSGRYAAHLCKDLAVADVYRSLTGGVCRILDFLYQELSKLPLQAEQLDAQRMYQILTSEAIKGAVFGRCQEMITWAPQEGCLANVLLDIAWAQLPVDFDNTVLDREPLADAVPRLGIYVNDYRPADPDAMVVDGQRRMVTLCVPGYTIMRSFGTRSLSSIAAWPSPGFSKSVSMESDASAKHFMAMVHSNQKPQITQVNPSSRPIVYAMMMPGWMYIFPPRSSSSDFGICTAERVSVHIQYKNEAAGLTDAKVRDEAAKVAVDGIRVYFVIVCTGPSKVTFPDGTAIIPNVLVYIVSRTDDLVQRFIGINTVTEIGSSTLLAEARRVIDSAH
eukprot:m51a1_g4387 hypothetical protein (696) ;mRNA; f:347386-350319